ncbi:MAG: hypothetical protein IJX96_04865 [Clostridia bacterium]|nr:hypothetical protein [Clostridia bacterium]
MKNNNARKNRFLALFLSVLMVSAAGTAFASCNDSSSESSSSSSSSATSTKKDDGLIKNAGFEIDDVSDTKPVITSVSSWTRSVNSETSGSALSSKAASGVINTSTEKWDDLTKSNFEGEDFSTWTEEKAEEEWENMSVKDKLAYYDAWEENNDDDDKDVEDLEFYESFNIDSEDIPDCENPKTHYAEGDENASKNPNVLMIHNEYSNSTYDAFGTAQKYTSSTTVTVSAGTSAKFSVWVKTSDLTSSATSGDEQAAVDKGAYISITNSLGSTSLDPLEVKNINTEGVTTHNGWVQYHFYLKGASYADSTFTIVLGLGKGGGTNRHEYVNGYAFFDDITCETITNDTYDKAITETTKVVYHDSEKSEKSFHAGEVSYEAYAIDFAQTATSSAWTTGSYVLDGTWKVDPTTETRNGKVYTAAKNPTGGATTYQGLGISTEGDVNGVFTKSTMAAVDNDYLKAVYNKNFKDSEFIGDDDKVLMLLSANGAAYTAKSDATKVTLAPESYAAISFYVKTSAMSGFTGANATLIDGTNKTALSSIDTTTIATVDINDDTKDIYDGWVRYYFFVSNETDEAKEFSIDFGFGPTTVTDTTTSSYYTGFAAFTKFEYYTFADEKAFDSAASGTYAKVVSLTGSTGEAAGDSGFDSAAAVPSNAIENGFANPKNYKGVYSDSDYVNGGGDGENTALYTNANAGLLNKEHADNYASILEKLGGAGATWDSVIGSDATQPLVIYNDGDQTLPYGFIGKSTTISASSYATVSLRVKVSNGATASVYLVDMADDTHESFLSVSGRLTYWYDDDGNVCVKDPTSDDFNDKKDVAFKLQSNGLYKVNPSWSGAEGLNANDYYANLSAYEKDAENNLVVADGGVSYNYTDKWLNDGNDGIAFYYNESDQTYYADSAMTIPVKGFESVSALIPRYEATESKELKVQVKGTATTPVWQTVTFYIHTGDTAKNYRLEVWNGDRETATTNASGSYVIFDSYTPDAVDDKFATLIDQRVAEIDKNAELGSYFESVFSFYDSAKYLRYDEKADVNEVGNSYESYLSSSNVEGVAFLAYDKGNEHEIYADYSYSEYTVTPDADDDTTEDEEEEETAADPTNIWLLAISIAIAAVLIFAVVSLTIRKIVARSRKKRGSGALAKSARSKKDK